MAGQSLNDIMEMDHVITVGEDGTISEPDGIYAPEVAVDSDDGQILKAHEADMLAQLDHAGWYPLDGWSGQYRYTGPIMHPSEYIGGALEEYIRETPGTYVAVSVEMLDSEDAAGWMVLTRKESGTVDRCATIGHKAIPATHEVTHGPDDCRVTEKVCADCAESYGRRPALRAAVRPLA